MNPSFWNSRLDAIQPHTLEAETDDRCVVGQFAAGTDQAVIAMLRDAHRMPGLSLYRQMMRPVSAAASSRLSGMSLSATPSYRRISGLLKILTNVSINIWRVRYERWRVLIQKELQSKQGWQKASCDDRAP